jgi:hypothetical protein
MVLEFQGSANFGSVLIWILALTALSVHRIAGFAVKEMTDSGKRSICGIVRAEHGCMGPAKNVPILQFSPNIDADCFGHNSPNRIIGIRNRCVKDIGIIRSDNFPIRHVNYKIPAPVGFAWTDAYFCRIKIERWSSSGIQPHYGNLHWLSRSKWIRKSDFFDAEPSPLIVARSFNASIQRGLTLSNAIFHSLSDTLIGGNDPVSLSGTAMDLQVSQHRSNGDYYGCDGDCGIGEIWGFYKIPCFSQRLFDSPRFRICVGVIACMVGLGLFVYGFILLYLSFSRRGTWDLALTSAALIFVGGYVGHFGVRILKL